ncbi:YccF domain-containing protein [Nannocystis sp. SCPEA4]|uniref:YccF domain-containing protein n=1 Tax=Nannocystis sp. SCPEA4 TaxID=2996787 RepID=UPI0023EF365C|nr:YccF domain-containing protein [Nannocystis sp. SCPEA4]
MRLILNVLWFLVAGLPLFLGYFAAGVVLCLTIIGLPFGVQAFKLALFAAWPFGRVVVSVPGDGGALSAIGNLLWLIFAGIWLAIGHLLAGLILCLTIIGIPFGIACMRLAGLALTPFGKTILGVEEERRMHQPHQVVVPAMSLPRT